MVRCPVDPVELVSRVPGPLAGEARVEHDPAVAAHSIRGGEGKVDAQRQAEVAVEDDRWVARPEPCLDAAAGVEPAARQVPRAAVEGSAVDRPVGSLEVIREIVLGIERVAPKEAAQEEEDPEGPAWENVTHGSLQP